MAWIGKSLGIFKLHDSDNFCGSYISIPDLCEILDVHPTDLTDLPKKTIDGAEYISELEVHRAWGAGRIISPYPPRLGNSKRSFDEIILIRLLELTLPHCLIKPQIPFGRKRVDIKVSYASKTKLIEFIGPSHFIRSYGRDPISPLIRKSEIERYFNSECILWPYWIQRCARNINAIFKNSQGGLASVWSTFAHFGSFTIPTPEEDILAISHRFDAVKPDGLGYMYSNRHTNKPVHPIVEKILVGKEKIDRLIPSDSTQPPSFWLPAELHHLVSG